MSHILRKKPIPELLVAIQCLKNRILVQHCLSPVSLSVCKQHKWTKLEKVFILTYLQVSLLNRSSVYYNVLYTQMFIIAVCSFTVSSLVHKTCNVRFTYAQSKPYQTIPMSRPATKFSENHVQTNRS